jgi:hypothetical protein
VERGWRVKKIGAAIAALIKSWHLLFWFANHQCRAHRRRCETTFMQAALSITDNDALLTEVQAADLLHLSVRTLQAWRSKHVGPPFVRAGRAIRYRRCGLLAWVNANTVVPDHRALAGK